MDDKRQKIQLELALTTQPKGEAQKSATRGTESSKAIERFKKRVRELTRRRRGVSIEKMAAELAVYLNDGGITSLTAKPRRCYETWTIG